MRILSLVFVLGLAVPAIAQEKNVSEASIMVCVVERSRTPPAPQINFTPFSEAAVIDGLVSAGLDIRPATSTPLFSKEVVEYSVLSTTGRMSALAGYVHLESGSDGSLSFTSDKGAAVVLKTEINSIHWILDKAKLITLAKEAAVSHLLTVEVEVEDITERLTDRAQYGAQRSIQVSLNGVLSTVPRNRVVVSYSNAVARMNPVVSSGVKDAARQLGKELGEQITTRLRSLK